MAPHTLLHSLENEGGFIFLFICTFVFWSLAYVFALLQGHFDTVFAFPLIGAVGNLSWEFIYTLSHRSTITQLGRYVNGCWLFLDLLCFYQFFKYGHHEPELRYRSDPVFYLVGFGAYFAAYSIIWCINDPYFSTFAENLLMSYMFVRLFHSRKIQYGRHVGTGQSLAIAILKFLGSFTGAMSVWLYQRDHLTGFGGVYTFVVIWVWTTVLDLIYIHLILSELQPLTTMSSEELDLLKEPLDSRCAWAGCRICCKVTMECAKEKPDLRYVAPQDTHYSPSEHRRNSGNCMIL